LQKRRHYDANIRDSQVILKGFSMRFLFAAFSSLFVLTACTTSPTSGQPIFTGMVSEQEENRIGSSQHADILKQYHGISDNAKLNEYVAMIGAKLAPHAERQGMRWTFSVLDDDMINAFAVPGGYVYVTRGLLELAQDESQIAAVLGHEMGHVNARHSAQQMSQGMLANIGLQAIGIATGSNAATQIGGLGAQAFIMKYSREHEFEADALGIKYLAAAGYDPYAASKFLTMLQQSAELEARMVGSKTAQQPSFFASHPMTPDRIVRARALADQMPKIKDAIVNRGVYLRAIDGTVYGDAVEEGFIRGNTFTHPGLKIRYEVPAGFKIKNGEKQVVAENDRGAAVVFDTAKAQTDDPAQFITKAWAPNVPLTGQERITVNSLSGATAAAQMNTNKGPRDAQLVAISAGGGNFYRLLFVAPPGQLSEYATAFRRTTYSFQHNDSIVGASPTRVALYTVKSGDTIQSLAAKMPVQDYAVERFCLLNNLMPGYRLEAGDIVKIVR
jgi:predicted Zn-dependent protease